MFDASMPHDGDHCSNNPVGQAAASQQQVHVRVCDCQQHLVAIDLVERVSATWDHVCFRLRLN